MSQLAKNQESTLQRRPEARGFRVEQLLHEAADGRMRIPTFQRPLRWRSKNVIDFFDSIRRGFPVGELLLSRDRAEAGIVNYGPVAIDAAEQSSALWVVDGQQRITALVATLLRREVTPRGDCWSVWYDLQGETFKLLLRRESEPAWIPLNVLCDSVKLLKWIRNWPYADEHEDLVHRALELGKSIREYEMPAYIVEGTGEDLLRLIFTRVNTGGVGMRESEIFEALYGGEGEKPIRSAVARLTDLGFGQLDEDIFLRCLRVTCGLSVRDPIDSPDKLPKDSIRRTEAALRRAITSISLAAGIPHWKLLPYRLPLIFLPAFYDQFPDEDSRIDRLVAKWIWRGALTGDHEDVTDSRVNRLVKQMREAKSSSDAVVGLLAHFDAAALDSFIENDAFSFLDNSPSIEIDQKISLSRATGKIFVLGLLAAIPRRPGGAEQLTLWAEDSDDAEAPDATLDPTKIYWSLTDQGNVGSDTIIKVADMKKKEIFSADIDTLRSFLLSEEAIGHLGRGSVDDFRECRRKILADYFKQFIADRLGDRVDVRPSIGSIVEAVAK
ncbi:MAG: DUF262 domain-containing protein [Planctomycetota bacterium]